MKVALALFALLVCFLTLASSSPTAHPPPHTKSTSTHKPHTKSTSTHKPHTKSTSTHKPHTKSTSTHKPPPTPVPANPLQDLVNIITIMEHQTIKISKQFEAMKHEVHEIVELGKGAIYHVQDPLKGDHP